jgi:hypothetical protein
MLKLTWMMWSSRPDPTTSSSLILRRLSTAWTVSMKAQPNKVYLWHPQVKLLGFIVSHRGIKAKLEKINAIIAMDAPKMIKDVQKLTGCMVALNRFISRLGERGLPFFKLLKHHDKFKWTEEANQALQDLKHHLQSPPILTAP